MLYRLLVTIRADRAQTIIDCYTWSLTDGVLFYQAIDGMADRIHNVIAIQSLEE